MANGSIPTFVAVHTRFWCRAPRPKAHWYTHQIPINYNTLQPPFGRSAHERMTACIDVSKEHKSASVSNSDLRKPPASSSQSRRTIGVQALSRVVTLEVPSIAQEKHCRQKSNGQQVLLSLQITQQCSRVRSMIRNQIKMQIWNGGSKQQNKITIKSKSPSRNLG